MPMLRVAQEKGRATRAEVAPPAEEDRSSVPAAAAGDPRTGYVRADAMRIPAADASFDG
jgi:hypothetical protein